MTEQAEPPDPITVLIHNFMAGLRAHFTATMTEEQRELATDRMIGVITAAIGAVLILLPLGDRRPAIADMLLRSAIRLIFGR